MTLEDAFSRAIEAEETQVAGKNTGGNELALQKGVDRMESSLETLAKSLAQMM